MIDESEFKDESGDPELAFVRLEAKFRAALNDRLSRLEDNSAAYEALYIEYINHVLAAADALGLDILQNYSVPSRNARDIWDTYANFTTAVDHFAVKIKIAHAQGYRAYSVVLTPTDKEKVRHYVEQIKSIIDKSTLVAAKKDALYDKINEFLAALDKDRTGLQAFAEFATGSAQIVADVAETAEPSWKWFGLIAALFGVRLGETKRTLPKPSRAEQLEGPSKRLPPPPSSSFGAQSRLDDDIPF